MDKIFVKDFLKEVEIGAFESERDCTQRVKFDVCLEIKAIPTELNDNVDKVLSYEVITEAIELELGSQRFNLLETLAERVADRCLREPRVLLAKVRIEKLDRIPGSLGVSVSRSAKHARKDNQSQEKMSDLSVAIFSCGVASTDVMKRRLSALLSCEKKITILVDSLEDSSDTKLSSYVKSQVALLEMDQNAWRLSCTDQRLSVVSTKAELNWAFKNHELSVFCLSQYVRQCNSKVPDFESGSDEFLGWFVREMGIKSIYFVDIDEKKLKTDDSELNIRYLSRDDWNRF